MKMVRIFEAELDNFREALAYAFGGTDLGTDLDADAGQRVRRGAQMVRALGYFAAERGYTGEAVRLRERALEWSTRVPFPDEVVFSLNVGISWLMGIRGQFDRALTYAEAGLRAAGDDPSNLASAQKMVALAHLNLGHSAAARTLLEASLDVARARALDLLLADVLSYQLMLEVEAGNLDAQQRLVEELREVAARVQDALTSTWVELNGAQVRWREHAAVKADTVLHGLLWQALGFADPMLTLDYADAA